MKSLLFIITLLISVSPQIIGSFHINKYNVIWDTPSKDAKGSMPLGNGDIGLNVWVEPSGDIILLIGKTDAFDENSILQKLGRIRIKTYPNPLFDKLNFNQELNLSKAEINVSYNKNCSVKIWVDANNPIINVETVGNVKYTQSVQLETWRDSVSLFKDTQVSDIFKNLTGPDPYDTYIYPDTVCSHNKSIIWYHSNCKPQIDGYEENLRIQGLESLIGKMKHPLYQRIYGGAISGKGFVSYSDKCLKSKEPSNKHLIQIACLTMHPASTKQWKDSISSISDRYLHSSLSQNKKNHDLWWTKYWDRSKIEITTSVSAEKNDVYELSRAYNLSRFMNACAGRGALPIKFNGSIFSYGKSDNPDYRRWGGTGFWFQNQRHTYYPMYAQGDFDLMKPFFKQYHDILPFQKKRTKRLLGHEGAFFPETIFFWGAEVSSHYGWTPINQRKNKLAECTYLTYYFQNGIELSSMMIDYWNYTKDSAFLKEVLIPHVQEITLFYDLHYLLDNGGKMLIAPASALETYHIAINPLPEIAGLKYILPQILQLPSNVVPEALMSRCERLLEQTPDIPTKNIEGKELIVPAESWKMEKNFENPELYAVFPYRLFGDKKANKELALNAYHSRLFKNNFCWHQDVIQATLLGLKDEAKKMIINRASKENYSENRFPVFWNSGWDWTPDVDHGGVLQNALILMLLQCEGEDIRILPCFPENWDVYFKLHAPNNTVVECEYKSGNVKKYSVTSLDKSYMPNIVIF